MKNKERPSQRLQIKDAPPANIMLEQKDPEPKEEKKCK